MLSFLTTMSRTAIKDSVEFVPGNEGLPKVQLKHNCGASAEVCAPRFILAFDIKRDSGEWAPSAPGKWIVLPEAASLEHQNSLILFCERDSLDALLMQIYLFGACTTSWKQVRRAFAIALGAWPS